MSNSEEVLVFDDAEATSFIHDKTGLDHATIAKVLSAEIDYMIEVGLIQMKKEGEEE